MCVYICVCKHIHISAVKQWFSDCCIKDHRNHTAGSGAGIYICMCVYICVCIHIHISEAMVLRLLHQGPPKPHGRRR